MVFWYSNINIRLASDNKQLGSRARLMLAILVCGTLTPYSSPGGTEDGGSMVKHSSSCNMLKLIWFEPLESYQSEVDGKASVVSLLD